jgi:hypothetical protein
MRLRLILIISVLVPAAARPALAQDRGYFVAYSHYLEEAGDLEVGLSTTAGFPREDSNRAYQAPWLEVEYGVTGWWTSELYLESQAANGQSMVFTGVRLEQRFRPLAVEHRVNPVLYIEYEHVNEASRIQKEVVGSGGLPFEPNEALKEEFANELEARLILSSAVGNWNVTGNAIVEKNFTESEGLEFGYAAGVSRSLGGIARERACRWCGEAFTVGVEAYGALGDSRHFAGRETRHYVAPVLAWTLSPRQTLKASVGVGLTDVSDRFLVRVGWTVEWATRRVR